MEWSDHAWAARERRRDIERRLRPRRRIAFAVLALALTASGPWTGWWWIAPLLVAIVVPGLLVRHAERARRPELWQPVLWIVGPLMIALATALTGASQSPAMFWLIIPSLTLQIRFERRGTRWGLAALAALLAGSTVLPDPAAFADDPTMPFFALSLLIASSLLAGAVVESDREHRRDVHVDSLTGVLNRSALFQRLPALVSHARRTGESLGALVLDIDGFKAVNDVHGHALGDEILTLVAGTVSREVRGLDLVFRTGGEEFVVILPGVGCDEGFEIAERIRLAVRRVQVDEVWVTISIGVASAAGRAAETRGLLQAADAAMYEAKRAGKDRVRRAPRAGRHARESDPLALARPVPDGAGG